MDNLEIDPREVKARLDRGEKFLLVDVRQQWEHEMCRIEGARLIPLSTVPEHLSALDAAHDVVLYCHHGKRSLDATVWLRQQGVEGARSMAGGIARWSAEIDPSVPQY
ncbi:MAG TPA: rhodanese-like domain-containing protein [Candidatus Acidoferrales bacterium]